MKLQLPTTIAPYLLSWGALLVLGVAFWIGYVEWRHTREDRRSKRAMSRSVGRILRDAARGEDYRSWR